VSSHFVRVCKLPVTSCMPCDELTNTMWRDDCVTSWSCDELTVTSWLFDELTMWRVGHVTSWLAAVAAWHHTDCQALIVGTKVSSSQCASYQYPSSCWMSSTYPLWLVMIDWSFKWISDWRVWTSSIACYCKGWSKKSSIASCQYSILTHFVNRDRQLMLMLVKLISWT